jgi:uncharacterized membrane protein (DUF373 family)
MAAVATDGGDRASGKPREPAREAIARMFTRVEDVIYVGLAVLLAAAAAVLLGQGVLDFWRAAVDGRLSGSLIALLEQALLVLIFVELLYTVQVSFREHVLAPEPFLLVALIAGVRRILVLTAEAKVFDEAPGAFRNAMIELGLLSGMTIALVASLVLLRRHRATPALAERA